MHYIDRSSVQVNKESFVYLYEFYEEKKKVSAS